MKKKSRFAIDYKKYFPEIITTTLFNILPKKLKIHFVSSPLVVRYGETDQMGSASQQLSALL